MRIGIALAALAVTSCGGAPGGASGNAADASEVTVVLPPPAPPLGEDETEDAPAGSGRVGAQQQAWAGVLRRVGFPCERITSVRESGAGYRVDCAGGGPYRATRRDGRIKFSRWRSA